MISQDKIFQNPGASSFINYADNNKKIGCIFFVISVMFHGVFFGGILFFLKSKPPKLLPPVIQMDLISFTPDPVPEDPDPTPEELKKEKTESKSNEVPKKKIEIKKIENKEIPTIKPDISLKTKPKNLKKLMAEKKKEEPKKIVKKVKPEKIKKVEKKKTQPQKKIDSDKILEQARKQLEKQVEEQNQNKLAKALKRLQEQIKNQGIKKNSNTGFKNKGYKPIDLYKMVLGAAIEKNWVFSDALAKMNQNLEVRVLIKILKNGVIRDVIYETRSGNRYLDDSAKKAIQKANPLPHLPAGMQSYDVVVIFTPKGLK